MIKYMKDAGFPGEDAEATARRLRSQKVRVADFANGDVDKDTMKEAELQTVEINRLTRHMGAGKGKKRCAPTLGHQGLLLGVRLLITGCCCRSADEAGITATGQRVPQSRKGLQDAINARAGAWRAAGKKWGDVAVSIASSTAVH
jgi:hypothetical protein